MSGERGAPLAFIDAPFHLLPLSLSLSPPPPNPLSLSLLLCFILSQAQTAKLYPILLSLFFCNLLTTLRSLYSVYTVFPLLPASSPSRLRYLLRAYTHLGSLALFSLLLFEVFPVFSASHALFLLLLALSQLPATFHSFLSASDSLTLPPSVVTGMLLATKYAVPLSNLAGTHAALVHLFRPQAYLQVTPVQLLASAVTLFYSLPSLYCGPLLARLEDDDLMSLWGYPTASRVAELENIFRRAEPCAVKERKREEKARKGEEMRRRGVEPGTGRRIAAGGGEKKGGSKSKDE